MKASSAEFVGKLWFGELTQCVIQGEFGHPAVLRRRYRPRKLPSAAGEDAMRRCEAYYYAGELARAEGQGDAARDLFQRCLDTGVTEYLEYGLARWRLQ